MSDWKLSPVSAPLARHVTTKNAALATARRAMLSFLMAVALGLLPAALNAQAAAPTPQASSTLRIVKGRILVRPKAGLSTAELDKILAVHGGRRVQYLRQINVHVVELPAQASELGVVNALRRNPHIQFAEPDVVMDPSLYVNDPYYNRQWHLPKINVPAAWDARTGSGVTIAILDTGLDSVHPDFAGQLVAGWNTFDNNNNTADVLTHGTVVAGVAGAAGNNSIGVAGVSFGAKIMPIRVTDTSGYGYASAMAQGVIWAADHGARVANLSFQGACASSTILSAAQYMRSKGGVVVAGSGNTGLLESYPVSDYCTVVSATDTNNAVTTFSSFGPYVDIAAPGASITTTVKGGSYTSTSGTSVSSPVVAGVYALMISANPTLPPAQLDSILFSTATDIGVSGKDDKSGWGVVSASAAVAKAMQTTATDSTAPTASISSPAASAKLSGLAGVSVAATDNIAVARTELHVNGALYATETVAPYAFALDTTRFADGDATLVAKAFDAAGNAGVSGSVAVTIANDTVLPVVTIQNPVAGSTVSGSVTVNASATDNQKVAQISLSIDGKEVAVSYGSSLSYAWSTGSTSTTSTKRKTSRKTSTTTLVSHTLTVAAKDAAGNQATTSITVLSQ